MAENKKDAEQDKAAPKAKGKPNLLENKALVLGIIVIVQAVVAIGLTQFVIVPRLGVGAAAAGGEAVADAHGEKPAAEGKHGEEAKGEKKEKKEKKGEKKAAHGGGGEAGAEGEGGNLADLQEIIVTLAGDSARPRYLRIAVNLEMADPEFVPLVVGRRPQLRDAVIMTLSDKTPAMLSTPDGKKRLREEIFRRASEQLPEGALLNVYFSDLVVQ
ncbi:MAG: flagellar basal body-associated FliL family protein [bacterium]|jgi:flagellar FliL protein|nr:flagellar basal body-associated FliL family protein [bacterium]MBK9775235.1 flagellar basal body-associated FliL family protein [bacterium]